MANKEDLPAVTQNVRCSIEDETHAQDLVLNHIASSDITTSHSLTSIPQQQADFLDLDSQVISSQLSSCANVGAEEIGFSSDVSHY